jgi:hypothetical protein
MPCKLKPLSDQIRDAVDSSGATRRELARAAKIDETALSRFMSRERGLETKYLDQLAGVLGLRVVAGLRHGKRS